MPRLSRAQPKLVVKKTNFQDAGAFNEIHNLVYELTKMRQTFADSIIALEEAIHTVARSSDPDNPSPGSYVIWLSDGTASGDAGDLMCKITDPSGVTKTTTLVDFSAI
jgi:hypothetical protein